MIAQATMGHRKPASHRLVLLKNLTDGNKGWYAYVYPRVYAPITKALCESKRCTEMAYVAPWYQPFNGFCDKCKTFFKDIDW